MVEHLLVHVLLLDALRADSLRKFGLKNHIDFQDFQDFAWNWNKIFWIWRFMCFRSASRGRTCTGAVFWSVLLKCFWNINPDVCYFETVKLRKRKRFWIDARGRASHTPPFSTMLFSKNPSVFNIVCILFSNFINFKTEKCDFWAFYRILSIF